MEQPRWGKALSKCCPFSMRFTTALMGFFAILISYMHRVSLSLAIIKMVVNKHQNSTKAHGSSYCPGPAKHERDNVGHGGDYDWSEEQQGMILSSFYVGYLLSHIPLGIMADKMGGKWILGLGVLISAICCVLTSLMIKIGGIPALIISRVVMGLSQGGAFPALSVLLSQWVPARERSSLGCFAMGGGQAGTIVTNFLSGLLLDAYKWDVTFYVFGSMGFVWFVIFVFVCFNAPARHPFISEKEKEYLLAEMGALEKKKDTPPIPWCAMFKNAAILSLIAGQIGHDWGLFIMISDLPKYMSDVLNFSIKESGAYSALPYVLMWVCSISSGIMGDVMIRKHWLSTLNTRKLWTTLAAVGPGVFMVLASYAECNRFFVMLYFTISMGLMGTFFAGLKLTPLDICPNFVGIVMAIANGAGAITGVVAPYLAGLMTPNSTLHEWRAVFWVACIALTISAIIYDIWASADIQPFNDFRKEN